MRLGALAALLIFSASQESKYRITDLGSDRKVDYLVVAAEAFVNDCDVLLAHREKRGLKVGLVAYSQTAKEPSADNLIAFLKTVREKWGVKFLLLVGDAVGPEKTFIPMKEGESKYYSEKYMSEKDIASDYEYSTTGGGDPVLHVGRFPADTKDELAAMIDKTIRYETKQTPGPWQRRISFITGEAGFDPMIDRVIEAQFTKIVSENIPSGFDIEVAYAQTASKYCPFPPKFNENAVRMLNEGALFYVYVGHGWREGCDRITWREKDYDILSVKNAAQIDIKNGLPVMVVIACSTGYVDSKGGDCLGEILLKGKTGPVAFLGGSRVTQPYGNALLGKELVAAIFGGQCATIGEAIDESKKKILAPDDSPFRKTADNMAGTVQGRDNLEGMRSDVVRHYNLLGDPAVVLQKPGGEIAIETLGIEAPGKTLSVKGKAPFAEGKAILTFECPREKFARELEKLPKASADDFEEKIAKRYQQANDKAFVRLELDVKAGVFTGEIAIPEKIAAGSYTIKAFAWNGTAAAIGTKGIKID